MSLSETAEEVLESFKKESIYDGSSQISPTNSPGMGQVTSSYYVPRVFHKFIGRSSLTSEFPCKLKFPLCGKSQDIRITAESQGTIDSVVGRINDIVTTTRPKLRPSHFICLPIQDCTSVETFKAFKSKVLERAKENRLYEGIDEDLFTSEYRLHFTFATLLLVDRKEVEKASRLLVSFFDESEAGKELSSAPLRITIRGLMSMQSNPDYSHVLYATVQRDGDYARLQAIANAISSLYRQYGLHSGVEQTPTAETDVKLHMTLMNSYNPLKKQLYRTRGPERRRLKRRYFNATPLLTEFGDLCFTEGTVFDVISLCRMNSGSPETFYATEAQLKLTETRPDTVDQCGD
ncbi:Activating signal cointegrator 1 complex subunit 1 [Echinococcus granulosus]|uniref:Activating signal cointegrator 1 complex subunit n=2 Tax=Echinococcus granulosus TaxID=6210 RepID=A0A068WLX2_ECHGR|nr:Activating signal cointegrator 1 complex subunit 1 [Echinococcus granulosus]CDS18632.1 Activating signal cointegrator 1 complex subunit [Echinococcus granulosus]